MTGAEALVVGMVLVLCVAVWTTQGTLDPRLGALLLALAVLAAAAVALRRWFG